MTCQDIEKEFCDLMSRHITEFWHPEGWSDLVRGLLLTIAEVDPDCRITQLKEKFGGLRVYTEGTNDAAGEAIEAAEKLSFRICEQCGEFGVTRSRGGWLRTFCEPCAREKGWE